MKQSVHPVLIAVVLVVMAGVVYYAYHRYTGPPQYSEAEREKAIKMLLPVQANPNKQAPGATQGLLMPQARPPGQGGR